MHSHCGSVAERLKAPVLKTGEGRPSQSSNLCASAIYFCGGFHSNPEKFILNFVIKGLSEFFFAFIFIPYSSKVIHFYLHLERPMKNTRTVLYFLLNTPISFYIIQRIKKMLGNYSWQG